MRTTHLSAISLALVLSCSVLFAQENVALLGTAKQTSTYGGNQFPASIANDGNLTNFTATTGDDDNAMWEVDLSVETAIDSIVLHNRDNCCPSRLRDIVVSIHDISFEEETWLVDDLIAGTPPADIEDLWDSATFETEVLNLENELGGAILDQGPEFITVDLVDRTGGSVTGRFVRVLRIADPDLSGSGGGGNQDEMNILSLGEVEVYGEADVECPPDGDTHCVDLIVTPPLEDGPGLYEVSVTADDDSDDPISYTIFAKKGGQTIFVVGPQLESTTTFDLGIGSWAISATVDDGLFCDDVANDATCSEVTVEIENTTGNFALEGIATQSSDFGAGQFPAHLAVDGNLANITATAADDANAIWEVDLLQNRDIATVVLHNRADCCRSRLRDIIVSIHDIPFTEDAEIDDRVDGIPVDLIEDVWDSALFESAVLNPENVEGGATLDGPAQIILDVEALAGAKVTGRYVRVLRIADPDLSGTGGLGNLDENNLLTLAEVEVRGEALCGDLEGDTHCQEITVVNSPLDGGAGLYDIEVVANDESGDPILYTITAEDETGAQLVSGPSPDNTATFDLGYGTWTITATVDDEPLCDDIADDATCDPLVVEIVNPLGENVALGGTASQSSTWGLNQFPADLAIDGNLTNFTATAGGDENAIWEVELLDDVAVATIVLHNRDNCCHSRLRDLIVSIHDIPFTEDAVIDDVVNGVPIDEIEDVWDSALFESPVLNPENIEGGGTTAGPEFITVDVEDLAGEKVVGRYVRVLRISDPDLSGTGGMGDSVDEVTVLSLGEVEIYGGTACTEEEADTICEVLKVDPPGGIPGDYTAQVMADDNSGDTVWYTITATQTDGGNAELVFGPSKTNTTIFALTVGTWSIGAEVTDKCGPGGGDAVCLPKVVVVEDDVTDPGFVRGDADSSGSINLTDGVAPLNYLFLGMAAPACLDAADADDSGDLQLTDAIYIFNWLFLGGSAPPAPMGPTGYAKSDCGVDPTPDALDCATRSETCGE